MSSTNDPLDSTEHAVHLDTACLHPGQVPDQVYATSSFVSDDAQQAADLIAGLDQALPRAAAALEVTV